jgi:hypothetical protein
MPTYTGNYLQYFFPAATCDSLDYDCYQLTCNRCARKSAVLFSKSGAPDIEILGYYVQRMPFIPLLPGVVNSLHLV